MKFFKSDFVKIALTAIITAAVIIIYFHSQKPKLESSHFSFVMKSESGPITLDTAMMFRRTYVNDSIYRLIIRDSAMNNSPRTYQGFLFDTSSIEEMIHRNKAGKVPDKLIFYYGEDSPRTVPRAWHIIAYGVKGDTLLQTAPPGAQPSIMDKANPCPPNCPTN